MIIIITLFLYLSNFIFLYSNNQIKYIFKETISIYEIYKNHRDDKNRIVIILCKFNIRTKKTVN